MNVDKSTLLKFLIPGCLAIAAAIFQSMAIRQVVETDHYLVLNRDLYAGDEIQATDIRFEEVSRRFSPPGVVSKNDEHIAVGSSVIRNIKQGRLLLMEDLMIGTNSLDLAPNELPVKFFIDDAQVESGKFHIGEHVYLQFYNQGETVELNGNQYAGRDIKEIGPIRIVSIDSATARYAKSPNQSIRQISFGVKNDFQHLQLMQEAYNDDSGISLRNIYSRPMQRRNQGEN